ncbi:MAG: hypothetical protein DMG94_09230 [Acidobacteria bacterium]|nr:MAG: hypothetical protein DMG94_09230 [Acidobacteriota bacterium]
MYSGRSRFARNFHPFRRFYPRADQRRRSGHPRRSAHLQ